MKMPAYDHHCENCDKEFELEYSIKDSPPTKCPLCGFDGKVKRLISFAAPGKVELYGQDLVDKTKADTATLKKELYSSELAYSNFLGPDRYEKIQKQLDKRKR